MTTARTNNKRVVLHKRKKKILDENITQANIFMAFYALCPRKKTIANSE